MSAGASSWSHHPPAILRTFAYSLASDFDYYTVVPILISLCVAISILTSLCFEVRTTTIRDERYYGGSFDPASIW